MNSKKLDEIIVTRKDIMEFINNKFSDYLCSSCNEDQWLLEGADEKEIVLLLFSNSSRKNSKVFRQVTSAIPCYALICNNCGYIKTYSKYAVKLWKAGKESSERPTAE